MKINASVSVFLVLLLICCSCSNKRPGKPKVLVFSKTSGFHHSAIADGNTAIIKLGEENGFEVDTTTNASYFQEDSLKQYAAVVFLSTTGDVLNHYQEADFERYIQAGGGFVGIHAATDTEYDWGWYGRLVGAYFVSHPRPQEAVLNVVNRNHASTEHLPEQWKRTDEWYNFDKLNKNVNVLIAIDEKSYEGGTNGDMHPMAWYHDYEGGRAFYTELGHTEESYQNPQYLQHILGGIQYAIGDNKELDYDKAVTLRVPEDDRFVRTVLTQGAFFEPTEMAILPNLDILVAQRRGEIMLFDHETEDVRQVGFLDVYHMAQVPDVNAEEGVLGIAADPDFRENNFVFIYYSPADTSVNRLSRFVYRDGVLDMKSEKVILQLYSQRNICCHTGGSIAFGPGNLLYLSTGDNSTPFDEKGQRYTNNGYAPLDDRPGHEQFDARRTSGNTNDLRGKIIRIKVNEDGTYSIPEGNLFPGNNPKARPEIYTMGHRNPYRISVDQKNGYLYWGDVGPDAREDSLIARGPRGYDEVNQARKPGYFGWPLFIGDNYAYHQYNYATGDAGPTADPAKPVNRSRNNTGLQQLPPAQPAFIWYPYGESPDFPQVGSGGRSAMAGPVYYTDMYPQSTRYAEYYNGKLFIYDWIRNWIKVVTMLPNGDLDKMEPFIENADFVAPMDMEVGPDGKIYVLEYGQGWFSKNPEAGLSRIDYLSGNRPPKIKELTVNKTSGKLPFTAIAKVEATDPENDRMRYVWKVGNRIKETWEPTLEYTFGRAGDNDISVEVFDIKNASAKSNIVSLYAGNEQPQVNLALQGNRSFYFKGKPVQYQTKIVDPDGSVDKNNLFISADYVEGVDLAGASMGHQVVSEEILGKNLMLNSDCKSCHQVEEKSIGPAFMQVAQRYRKNPSAYLHLTNKIIEGGSGVWGEANMPAHPDMSATEARQIVKWVLSLGETENAKKSLPANGQLMPQVSTQQQQNTILKLTATYTDQGDAGIRPLSASDAVYLRSNLIDVAELSEVKGFASKDSSGSEYLVFPAGEAWLKVEQLDLTGIRGIGLAGFGSGQANQYQVEVRLGQPTGRKIGEGQISFSTANGRETAIVSIQQVVNKELNDVYIVVKPLSAAGGRKPLLKTVQFLPQTSPAL
ncbi:ThuA domain-containing protein [Pontibacter silvestris]|uniref:ThuA domain-containing protein n=1 Tax=Pontibacter silvestris TaxID=2305183 RepID=A0ABW4WSG9_9BACT|nr:ThuA domain-containing protein [Pontibacter silvestris]MCC9137830.1 ThuA domain-containing protein [Pontibacter silvestris]